MFGLSQMALFVLLFVCFLSGTGTDTVGRDKTKEKKKVGHLHIVYYDGG